MLVIRAYFVHSDITHANILLKLPGLDAWSEKDIYRFLGAPHLIPLSRLDSTSPCPSAPQQVVLPIDFLKVDPKLLSGAVTIVDFSLAFLTHSPPLGIPGTPRPFLAPELCFGLPRSTACDVWGLGCLIFEVFSSAVLFPLMFDNIQMLLATIVDTLGAFPNEWKSRGLHLGAQQLELEQQEWWFDPSYQPSRPLDARVTQSCTRVPGPARPSIIHLISNALQYDPALRMPAQAISAHPLFAKDAADAAESGYI
jgi:serine/threonine protein kinase